LKQLACENIACERGQETLKLGVALPSIQCCSHLLLQVIKGWTEAMQLMVEGNYIFILPWHFYC
jgi:hypothetical protein